MRKIYLIALLSLILPLSMWAQTDSFEKGIFNLSVGAGFPNTTHSAIDASSILFSIDGDDTGSSTPFFLVSGVYGISDEVGIGIFTGYFRSDSEVIATGSQVINALNLVGANINLGEGFGQTKYSVFTIGGKLEIHEQLFRDIKRLDTYASTYLGFNIVSDDFDSIEFLSADNANYEIPVIGNVNINNLLTQTLSNVNYPAITYDVNAGLKYSLTDNLAIYGEAGFGRFLLNMGATLSLN